MKDVKKAATILKDMNTRFDDKIKKTIIFIWRVKRAKKFDTQVGRRDASGSPPIVS